MIIGGGWDEETFYLREHLYELIKVYGIDVMKQELNECEWLLNKLNQNKDEKDPKNKDGKDPNAIYDWGSFPLEKNFEWKNKNKDDLRAFFKAHSEEVEYVAIKRVLKLNKEIAYISTSSLPSSLYSILNLNPVGNLVNFVIN